MVELIKWEIPYDKIEPGNMQDYFKRGERTSDTLADLLLKSDSTAIFHMDPNRLAHLGDPKNPVKTYMRPLLLGVNYHRGHSEGGYKIVVQDIPQRKGPWVLFRPPGSNEDTFYLQDVIFPGIVRASFSEDVANPLKIKRFYLCSGNPLEIFESFQRRGFKFVDQPMSEEHYERLSVLSDNAKNR